MVEERITGKVAQILAARDLAINRGEDHGVTVGMRFAVLNRQGADITDPDTGESLGSVDLPKTFVKVVAVKPRLAIARTFRTFRTRGGPLSAVGILPALAEPSRTRLETLKTDEKTLNEELDETESYVKIGDPVVQVLRSGEFMGLDEDE